MENVEKKHQERSGRRVDLEILRLIAIFWVVFNHTQERGFELYMVPGCSRINYAGSMLLGILCKVAVPIFFLISGGLLLGRQERIIVTLRKRVLRIGVVLVLCSGVLYLCWYHWGYLADPGPVDFVKRLWANGISAPYWYLYTYLGLMLLLPFLRPMVQGMRSTVFVYLIGLHLLYYGVLMPVGLLCNLGPINPDLWIPFAEPNLFYFILGYYLENRVDWSGIGKRKLLCYGLLAVLAVGGMYVLGNVNYGREGQITMNFRVTLQLFPIFFLYAAVHQLCAWHPVSPRASRIIGALGSCVFGTYLLEGILRHELSFIYELLEPRIHVLPACMVWVMAVTVAGLGITWVLKRLPVLKKLL